MWGVVGVDFGLGGREGIEELKMTGMGVGFVEGTCWMVVLV